MESPTAALKAAVAKVLSTYEEWFTFVQPPLSEPQTRYALIDPIIRALGWDTEDPKVCYPEWGRKKQKADYALFAHSTAQEIVNRTAIPAIIIEAKSVYSADRLPNREYGQAILEKDIQQLQRYIDGEPKMDKGLAVFTNGRKWLLFSLGDGRRLNEISPVELDLERDSIDYLVEELYTYMGRETW